MIILGIDPGTATTGYGIVKKSRGFKCLDYGVIRTKPNSNPGERLKKINNEISKIIKKYQPDFLAIESLYFFRNFKTAIPVSQAKGSILLTAAKKKLPVKEFTPLQIKLAVAGNGRADKKDVKESLKKIFVLDKEPQPDDAHDAIAVALTCFSKKVKEI